MRLRLFITVMGVLCLATGGQASIIFRPGEKVKYVGPGEEEISGNAQQIYDKAQEAEKQGNMGRAIKAYTQLLKKHPKDALAPGATYRAAQLLEFEGDYMKAAMTYRWLVERYPSSPNFDEAIEAQFRVGEMYLSGKKIKMLGIPIATSLDRAVEIFAAIVRTAPFGRYTARAQFDIGLARQKQSANDAAIQAYLAVITKFPNDPIAADAQYQIGYIWFTASRSGVKDLAVTNNARIAFQDFLFRFPNSEKAAQARSNLQQLEHKATSSSFEVARFYDKQKMYRAAVIYYNEVIGQQPGSAESEKAKKRIDQLRAKVGEKMLEPLQDAEKKKAAEEAKTKGPGQSPPAPNSAPILPPDVDTSLPPPPSGPSSLLPPGSASVPASEATPEQSSTPAESAEP